MKSVSRSVRRHHTARKKSRYRFIDSIVHRMNRTWITPRRIGIQYSTHGVPCSCMLHQELPKPRFKRYLEKDFDSM